ncbi:MAG: D-alanine--D-alanine ligase, partial [Winogradskyella sp.]|nr:D-alanine--D-alanine ligase [Winogradskyella sp.]
MKKNIAVIMGGFSSEYEISLKSGAMVVEVLTSDKYKVFPIHIFKNKWVYVSGDNEI